MLPQRDTCALDLETHSWRRLRVIQIGVNCFWTKGRELERNVESLTSSGCRKRSVSSGPDRDYFHSKGIVRDVAACPGIPASPAGRCKKFQWRTKILWRHDPDSFGQFVIQSSICMLDIAPCSVHCVRLVVYAERCHNAYVCTT